MRQRALRHYIHQANDIVKQQITAIEIMYQADVQSVHTSTWKRACAKQAGFAEASQIDQLPIMILSDVVAVLFRYAQMMYMSLCAGDLCTFGILFSVKQQNQKVAGGATTHGYGFMSLRGWIGTTFYYKERGVTSMVAFRQIAGIDWGNEKDLTCVTVMCERCRAIISCDYYPPSDEVITMPVFRRCPHCQVDLTAGSLAAYYWKG